MKLATTKISHLARPFTLLAKVMLTFACIISLNSVSHAKANTENTSAAEYAVKVAYIYNILRFVRWDEKPPLAQSESLNICLFKKTVQSIS